jgi:hypothetical protein
LKRRRGARSSLADASREPPEGERVAGCSGTPLVKKLGIKPGAEILVVGAAEGYRALGLSQNRQVSPSWCGQFAAALGMVGPT